MTLPLQLLSADAHTPDTPGALALANDADVLDAQAVPLAGVTRIDLHFPRFTDGRAYSQARLLRTRRGFTGDIRATGDVLIDQLLPMARKFARFAAFYQGDAVQPQPHFARPAAKEPRP